MPETLTIVAATFLLPLAVIISYYDISYRRIPNPFVIATLVVGILTNAISGGFAGALTSLGGCALAFFLMFVLHVFGAMGAGDVKLFAAIGSITGAPLVLPTFFVVTMLGGLLGLLCVLRAGQFKLTMMRVYQILLGLMPGYTVPRFPVPPDGRYTIPYGVAITFGSLLSLAIFRA